MAASATILALTIAAGGTALAAPSTPTSVTTAAGKPPIPSARVGNHLVVDSSTTPGPAGKYLNVSSVAAPDGTTWIAWISTQKDNGFNGDPEIKLCWLPAAATTCASVATYHDPASSTTSALQSTNVQGLHLSRTPDGTLYLVFATRSIPFSNPGFVSVITSTHSGKTLSAPTVVGRTPPYESSDGYPDDAVVDNGYVNAVFDQYAQGAGLLLSYSLLSLDGSQAATFPIVQWTYPAAKRLRGEPGLAHAGGPGDRHGPPGRDELGKPRQLHGATHQAAVHVTPRRRRRELKTALRGRVHLSRHENPTSPQRGRGRHPRPCRGHHRRPGSRDHRP